MEVIPLDFVTAGGITVATDEELMQATSKFFKNYLAEPVDPRKMQKVWVVRDGRHVLAVSGFVYKADVPLFRSISEGATQILGDRMNSYFSDQGMRGAEVFLYLNQGETLEQRCPNREKFLNGFHAKPADRYSITVK